VPDDLRRFFAPPESLRARNVTITGDLAHRLSRVLRYRRGDHLILAGGGRVESEVQLYGVSANAVTGVVVGERPAPPEPAVELVLYQSIIRLNRFDFVLEKGTEAGVSRFVPMIAARTRAQLEGAESARSERWQRIIVEAAEQCGRGRLPTVTQTVTFEQAVRSAPGLKVMPWESERRLRLAAYLRDLAKRPATVSLFIGPEGGFDDAEIELAREAGAVLVTLGRRVMRSETAAIIAAGIVLHELDG
jgi:16S rRNA (uracil1498-N3)-methyltransferase